MTLSNKHLKTLADVFAEPVKASIEWTRIEALMVAAGADITEGAGSRVRVAFKGVRAVFHRPHPQKETDKGAVKSVRKLLTEAGLTP